MDRLNLLRDAVKNLLDSGTVDGVLALRADGPASAPHLFRPGDDLGDLVLVAQVCHSADHGHAAASRCQKCVWAWSPAAARSGG